MKKTALILAVVVLVPALVAAQDFAGDTGSVLIGGSAVFSSSGGDLNENGDGDRQTFVQFNPVAIYFISPGIGIGGMLNYSRSSQGDTYSNTFGIGPSLAYLAGGGGKEIVPFGMVTFLYNSRKTQYSPESKWNETELMFRVGALWMARKNVGISLAAFYSIEGRKFEDMDNISGNRFGLTVGVNTFLLGK